MVSALRCRRSGSQGQEYRAAVEVGKLGKTRYPCEVRAPAPNGGMTLAKNAIEQRQSILLDTGTNEVEILELLVNGHYYGVNVLKIRQLVTYDPKAITPVHLPGLHPSVMGTMLFHGKPIPVIDLCHYLDTPEVAGDGETPQVVAVCEFNNAIHGFRVDAFDKILRMTWKDIQVPSLGMDLPTITGVCTGGDKEVMLLDFEGIIHDVVGKDGPAQGGEGATPLQDRSDERGQVHVLLAEDSAIMRKQVEGLVSSAGYHIVRSCHNGEETLEAVMAAEPGSIDAVVTDIEMPRMDGLTLCKQLKRERPELSVVVLSSMISEQMAEKCRQVNADGYLSKTESSRIIHLLDELCLTASA